MEFRVVPSIFEKETDQENKLNVLLGVSNIFQIDLVDSSFTLNPNSVNKDFIKNNSDKIFFELHLMTENPLDLFFEFLPTGFKRFIGQVEKMENEMDFIKTVVENNMDAWLAIDLNTNIEFYLNRGFQEAGLTGLTIMTVNAGSPGQLFEEKALVKVKKVRAFYGENFNIEVDGGINEQNIVHAKEAGANLFAINSFIFNSPDPRSTYMTLQQRII